MVLRLLQGSELAGLALMGSWLYHPLGYCQASVNHARSEHGLRTKYSVQN